MSYTPGSNRYEKNMQYRRCGSSGIKLPALSLGLWHNFGDVDDFNNCREILFTAFDNGITHFDLANNYGPPPGSAETNFGKILKDDFASLPLFSHHCDKHLILLVVPLGRRDSYQTMRTSPTTSHLPPHLREVCDLLARGLVRLRARQQRLQSRQVSDAIGESSLHFLPDQRGHAKPNRRRI